jgi:hypothetical protein
MAFLLRTVTKPKWVPPDWIAAGDVPADALTDLRTIDNELSVWRIEQDHSNLKMALAAVASNKDRLDKLDYTLFDEAILPAIPIQCITSEGGTPHAAANAAIHRDLTELTVKKVSDLAHEIMATNLVRVPEKDVKLLLREALQSGALDRARIKPKLLSDLESSTP